MQEGEKRYPPIGDYALISDCHCAALISREGSVDWCCMPRLDSDSCFGRLLDWDKGGYCLISPVDPFSVTRRYLPGTMILETLFRTQHGEARVLDFFSMNTPRHGNERGDHVRIVEGISGDLEFRMEVCPRFDYGSIVPHVQRCAECAYSAIGSNKGLVIKSDVALEPVGRGCVASNFRVSAGTRVRLVILFEYPEAVDALAAHGLPSTADIDGFLENTQAWWQEWSGHMRAPCELDHQTQRSAIVLKSLTFERTGAIAAAATTSLPEWVGGGRNWDYRFSWIRDSVFAVRALQELGCVTEADRFHQFIQRTSAGDADQMQIMYGVDGKRRLTEIELDWLDGYRGSKPVRIGNRAAKQMQLDIYGELLEMAWTWHFTNHDTDERYWHFLRDVVEVVCARWQDADQGIWELRGPPRHHVHSKGMCWAAVNRGIMLAQANGFDAPFERWSKSRDEIRDSIERDGVDSERGVFVQAYGSKYLDASLLLLPSVGFVDYRDPRMLRTADAICEDLDRNGLLARYNAPDNIPGPEGMFLPCTFWLVTCLARQGRRDRAMRYYRTAVACANDLGLFSEEYDPHSKSMLGNFPQGLTHVSQITARLALEGH